MKKIFKKKIIIPLLIILIIGGYFGYKNFIKKEGETRYTLTAAQKGTLVVSVSGSGQVSASDQIDIKPKTPGDIIAIYITKDQEVKEGQTLALLDSASAERGIREAQVSLDSAKKRLEELISYPDEKTLLQSQNALAQAERDLEKAKENYQDIITDAENSLTTAYEDAYTTISTTFLKLADYMKDLKDVAGTERSPTTYINDYTLLLGSNSPLIQRFLDDYNKAIDSYNKASASFVGVYRDAEREVIYELLSTCFESSKIISQALESGRHMYRAAVAVDNYKYFSISSYIDKMLTKIESDVSSVYSNISSLQKIKDTIDNTVAKTPGKIEDGQLAIQSAQEKLDDKKEVLEEMIAGADPLDIDSQRNTVEQRESALKSAKETLANTSIRAPFDGIIAEVNSKVKIGDSVSTGTVLGSIITKQKIAEVSFNEIDAAKIKVGQKATLTFDALPETTLTGKVVEVDTIGTVSQGVVSYGVKIAFDTDDERIKPGMSVTVDIITEAKTDVLVLPNSAVKYQAGAYYVELVEAPEEMRQQLLANASVAILPNPAKFQPVEIGLSNDTMTEIVSGLKQGDIVVSSTISSTQTTTQTQGTQQFQIPGIGTQMRVR